MYRIFCGRTRVVGPAVMVAVALLIGGCALPDKPAAQVRHGGSDTGSPSASATASYTTAERGFIRAARDRYGFDGNSDADVLSVGRDACGYRSDGASQDTTVKKMADELRGADRAARAGLVELAEKHLCRKYRPKPVVRFVVTGSGSGVDITYGSDTDNRQGGTSVPFSASLKLDRSADYYSLDAQLNGSGDITCKIIIREHVVAKGHASGGYNICSAQAGRGLDGSWTAE